MKNILNIICVLIFTITVNAQQKGNNIAGGERIPIQGAAKISIGDETEVSEAARDLNNKGIEASSEENDFEAAAELFRRAVESDSRCFQCRYNLGMALVGGQKYDEAIRVFEELVSLKPDYAIAFGGLGEAYDKKELYQESVEVYRRAVKLAPNDAVLLTNLGNALSKVQEYEEALTYLNKAVKLNNRLAETFSNRAKVLFALERYKEAVEDLKKAVALQPESPNFYNNLGVALGAMGKEKEARLYYAEALRLIPGWSVALYNLAISHLISGDRAAARQNVFALERVDPILAEKARKAVYGKYIVNASEIK